VSDSGSLSEANQTLRPESVTENAKVVNKTKTSPDF